MTEAIPGGVEANSEHCCWVFDCIKDVFWLLVVLHVFAWLYTSTANVLYIGYVHYVFTCMPKGYNIMISKYVLTILAYMIIFHNIKQIIITP